MSINVVAYDPAWPVQFSQLRDHLWTVLRGHALAIEHVGSTAVPGLAAKPIIDLDIVIASEDKLADITKALASLGYRNRGDLGVPGRVSFKLEKSSISAVESQRNWPAHHLYCCAQDNLELQRHLVFRDFLRTHPETVQAYANLKHRLAHQYPEDKIMYTEGKSAFIEHVLIQAGMTNNN